MTRAKKTHLGNNNLLFLKSTRINPENWLNTECTFIRENGEVNLLTQEKFIKVAKSSLEQAENLRYYTVVNAPILQKRKLIREWKMRVNMTIQETYLNNGIQVLRYPYIYLMLFTYNDENLPYKISKDKKARVASLDKRNITLLWKKDKNIIYNPQIFKIPIILKIYKNNGNKI